MSCMNYTYGVGFVVVKIGAGGGGGGAGGGGSAAVSLSGSKADGLEGDAGSVHSARLLKSQRFRPSRQVWSSPYVSPSRPLSILY